MERATLRYAPLCEHAAQTEVAHKVAYAQALLVSQGTVAVREALAIIAVETEFLARRIAEAKREAQLELLRTLRVEIDALRTLSATIRAQT